jgi:hypothetical protein
VDPVPDPLLLKKSGSSRNRARTSGSVARNSDHKTTGGLPWVPFLHITQIVRNGSLLSAFASLPSAY